MRKPDKADLLSELKGMMPEKAPTTLPQTNHQRAIIIDFMAYARKAPTKKLKLGTYNDFYNDHWKTFTLLATLCRRIDIIFDVYIDHSGKASEQRRRTTVDGIETVIFACPNGLLLVPF